MIRKTTTVMSIVISLLIMLTNCEDTTGATDVLVEGVTLNLATSSMEIGEILQLVATISPENATNRTLYWSSSAGGVASVSNEGLVTTKSDGIAIIKVRTEDGDFEAYCTVNVAPDAIHVTDISLDIEKDTLDISCTQLLTTVVYPEDATDKSIIWSSSDNNIAMVDQYGLVTGIGGGITNISATTNDGSLVASCEVLVNGVGVITEIMTKGFLETPASNVGVDMAVDATGNPFLAINAKDASLDSKASVEVWKYNGSWSQYGDRIAITDDEAYAPGIVIDNNNEVFVSHFYYDDVNDSRYEGLCVASSTGGTFSYLGTGLGSVIRDGNQKLNGGTEIAIKDDGTLMVATMDHGAGRVHYFDGINWKSYNGYKTNNTNSFWGGGIELECYGNLPYTGIRTSSGTGKTGVLIGNETNGVNGQWEWLGNSYVSSSSHDCSFQDEKVNDASLAIDSEGKIYSAYYTSLNGEWRVFVRMFDGSGWTLLGNILADDLNQVDVVVSNDIVYVLIAEYNDGIKIHKLNSCGKWISEGSTTSPDLYYNFDAVAGKNGEIFIGYECSGNFEGQVGVYKYIPYAF